MTQTQKQQSRILVIDDDRDIWKAYQMVLSPSVPAPDSSSAKISQLLSNGQDDANEPDFTLSFASQGQEGYEMVQASKGTGPFAMAFIDIRMPPGWDGMETASKIRQLDPDIELVIVTAYSDRSMEEIVRAVGSPDKLLFLRKPFDPEELKQITRAMTCKWHLERDKEQQQISRRHLEEQLQQTQKLEAIGTLAGGIAHDFNNILSAIMGYTDLALLRANDDKSLQDDLLQVRKASDRAADLVRQILTFSRRQQKENHPLLVCMIVKEAMKLLRASIPSTIEIRQKITSEATVLANPTQIHQLVMNLCTNAFHAMMDRGGILEVTLEDTTIGQDGLVANNTKLLPGRYVTLSVSDTGNGMSLMTISKIFEPYFTTKEKGKGTGLGLAVVHGIVEDHRGGIVVSSQPGYGTTFKVYLPVANQEAVTEPESLSAPRSRSGERVMVVDDESPLRDLLSQFLIEAGYRVDTFANGMEAWQALSKAPQSWDLLLTDQTMPGITGEQLAAMVMGIRPEMPILLCSGYGMRPNADQVKKMGVTAYLQKPLDRNTLLTSIATVLAETDWHGEATGRIGAGL
jgi:two-component system NtrC family sensor kinase